MSRLRPVGVYAEIRNVSSKMLYLGLVYVTMLLSSCTLFSPGQAPQDRMIRITTITPQVDQSCIAGLESHKPFILALLPVAGVEDLDVQLSFLERGSCTFTRLGPYEVLAISPQGNRLLWVDEGGLHVLDFRENTLRSMDLDWDLWKGVWVVDWSHPRAVILQQPLVASSGEDPFPLPSDNWTFGVIDLATGEGEKIYSGSVRNFPCGKWDCGQGPLSLQPLGWSQERERLFVAVNQFPEFGVPTLRSVWSLSIKSVEADRVLDIQERFGEDSPFEGSPSLGPEGKGLAYLAPPPKRSVEVLDINTGRIQEYPIPDQYGQPRRDQLGWTGDGKGIFLYLQDLQGEGKYQGYSLLQPDSGFYTALDWITDEVTEWCTSTEYILRSADGFQLVSTGQEPYSWSLTNPQARIVGCFHFP